MTGLFVCFCRNPEDECFSLDSFAERQHDPFMHLRTCWEDTGSTFSSFFLYRDEITGIFCESQLADPAHSAVKMPAHQRFDADGVARLDQAEHLFVIAQNVRAERLTDSRSGSVLHQPEFLEQPAG